MTLFSDSIQLMGELLRKSKKKKWATLEEADIDGPWLTAYSRLARRSRDHKDLGVGRYPYDRDPGVSPFAGGYIELRDLAILRSIERHPSQSPLFEYEAHYMNSAGYWMTFSAAAMILRGEALKQ
jgi:hypothetical protein